MSVTDPALPLSSRSSTVAPDRVSSESPAFTLVTVRMAGASSLDPHAFEACTRDAYTAIAARLRAAAARHPVRFWNYIPDIHRPCGEGLDRYMCFNAGRFADQHHPAFVPERAQQFDDSVLGPDVDASEGLVEQDDAPVLRQRPSEKDALLLPARKLADLALAEIAHADTRKR